MNTPQPKKVSLRTVRQAAQASIQNERVTRQRVDELARWANVAGPAIEAAQQQIDATTHIVGQHMDFVQMGLFARLRWVFTGALPTRPQPESVCPPVTKSEVA